MLEEVNGRKEMIILYYNLKNEKCKNGVGN